MELARIYVASSWRNVSQPEVVELLRRDGYEVYDFRNPRPHDTGFHWSEIDPAWKEWSPAQFRHALNHPIAKNGFESDFSAMLWADACVLVNPCGRSAHLEAGFFAGHPLKQLHILLTQEMEPELMYKMADSISLNVVDLLNVLRNSL